MENYETKNKAELIAEIKRLETTIEGVSVSALKESEERFRAFASLSFEGIAITEQGKIVDLNEQLVSITGYCRRELIGTNLDALVLPQDKKMVTARIHEDFQDLKEHRIVHKEGKVITVEVHGRPILYNRKPCQITAIHDISQRKEAETELTQNATFIDKIIDSSALSMWVSDSEGTAIRTNRACLEFFGTTEDEVIGKYNLFKDSVIEQQGFMPEVKRVFEKGEVVSIIIDYDFGAVDHVDARNATHKIVKTTFTPVIDSTGKVTNVISQAIDLTEIVGANEEIRRSKILLESSIESPKDMIILSLDKEFKYLYYNKTHALVMNQVYGSQPSIGECIFDCMKGYDDDIERIRQHYIRTLGGESCVAVEEFGTGDVCHFYEMRFSPIFDEKKEVFGIAVFAQNISKRMATEKKLVESEEKFRMLFEQMLDGFALHEMIFDSKGNPVDYKFLAINPAFETVTGLSRTQVIDKKVTEVVPSIELSRIEALGNVVVTGEPVQFEVYVQELEKYLDIVAFRPKEGQFASIVTDITEKRQMEAQLRQTEKMQAIGQLAGGVAHDFNNQLGGIVGYADLIRERVSSDSTLVKYADSIITSVERSADLTAQLLAFSRQGKYEVVPLDVHEIIHETVSILERSIDKRIVIKLQLNAHPPITCGDSTQLQNAILNLALNARDAMPLGGELLFATSIVGIDKSFPKSGFSVAAGSYIQISVTDSGFGMDKETQKRIFEPFFTTKAKGKGTGMGLAAVYGTVRSHGGFVTVDSEFQVGSTFKVYLPLASDDLSPDPKADLSSTPAKGSGHILLAEDDEMLYEVAVDILHSLGYTVVVCRNGKEALTYYEKSWQEVDLVLLDMVMPIMDGKETFIAMKKINPKITALLASGYSIDGEARDILNEGAAGFIQKPYRMAQLAEKIAELLK